jgi:hypothetical protein
VVQMFVAAQLLAQGFYFLSGAVHV